ncbi:MAG: hypothetical protein K2W94_03710 [Alphaproteobacteria bacterium]|nr:hypothetical protein [Alphaproteobacteria bacterium]
MESSFKFYRGGVGKLLSTLLLLNVSAVGCVVVSEFEDDKVHESTAYYMGVSHIKGDDLNSLERERAADLVGKAKGDPQRAFNFIAFDLIRLPKNKEVHELTADLMAVLRIHGVYLDNTLIFYYLGKYLKINSHKEEYQSVVDQMKDWIVQHYTTEDFSNAYYKTLRNKYKENVESFALLNEKWPEFFDGTLAVARFKKEQEIEEQKKSEEEKREREFYKNNPGTLVDFRWTPPEEYFLPRELLNKGKLKAVPDNTPKTIG